MHPVLDGFFRGTLGFAWSSIINLCIVYLLYLIATYIDGHICNDDLEQWASKYLTNFKIYNNIVLVQMVLGICLSIVWGIWTLIKLLFFSCLHINL